MTAAAGKKLDVGDRVRWSDGALGTVREISYAAVKIQWDDNTWCLMTFGDPGTPWHDLSYVWPKEGNAAGPAATGFPSPKVIV